MERDATHPVSYAQMVEFDEAVVQRWMETMNPGWSTRGTRGLSALEKELLDAMSHQFLRDCAESALPQGEIFRGYLCQIIKTLRP